MWPNVKYWKIKLARKKQLLFIYKIITIPYKLIDDESINVSYIICRF